MLSSKLCRPLPQVKRLPIVSHTHVSNQHEIPIIRGDRFNDCDKLTSLGKPIRHNRTHDQEDDHRLLGTALSLFSTHPSSPGSPLFHPDGTHIFQKLQAFLRAQYPTFGIREVLTPIIYKKCLWEQSGHWANYKSDIFTVRGGSPQTLQDQGVEQDEDAHDAEEYGLKPMNCPGHCLLFQSQKRGYKELPIRYADFSPLHRNEISGSLSGLTRLRRFHQDDGHIFCRPIQVGQEIESTLDFIRCVYETFDLGSYKLVLSTRPEAQFIGTISEWERAEAQLKVALEKSGRAFEIHDGDGAFYGPKIDVILTDSDGKEHQTATIQLDFQLPQRFGLEYHSPAPEQEASGISTTDPNLLSQTGTVAPVIIHRAVLGSLERFMALLIEHYRGHWPFWLSPRQMIILTVNSDPKLNEYAQTLAAELHAPGIRQRLRKLDATTFTVDLDTSRRSIAKKVSTAKLKRYNIIAVIGERNMKADTLDLTFCGGPNLKIWWDIVESVNGESHAKHEKMSPMDETFTLKREDCIRLMMRLCDDYL